MLPQTPVSITLTYDDWVSVVACVDVVKSDQIDQGRLSGIRNALHKALTEACDRELKAFMEKKEVYKALVAEASVIRSETPEAKA